MALFNEEGLKKKLSELNLSQQSIQTLSLWLIHHKKHAPTVVSVWLKELVKVPEARKLTFMYLANDVIQNSKKKGPEYNKEFGKRLPEVFEHLGSLSLDDKSKRGVNRLLTVWEERGVFGHSAIHTFKRSYEGLKSISIKVDSDDEEVEAPSKRIRRSNSVSLLSGDDSDSDEAAATPPVEVEVASSPQVVEEPPVPRNPPPETEVLLQALQSLETAASADAEVRGKIAKLPTEISDPSSLSSLTDAKQGEELLKEVGEALTLLLNYNARLAEEMETRKSVAKMLHDFILYQKDKLAETEETLEEYRQKLAKVIKIKAELKAHLQNLPDISRLPNMSSTLAPLPSAGDLFH